MVVHLFRRDTSRFLVLSQEKLLLSKNIPSSAPNESHTENLSGEHFYMMSGNIPSPDPQGSNLSPGGQPQGSNLPPGGQPQEHYIPQGQYIP